MIDNRNPLLQALGGLFGGSAGDPRATAFTAPAGFPRGGVGPAMAMAPRPSPLGRIGQGFADNSNMLATLGAGLLAHRQNAMNPMFGDPRMMMLAQATDQERAETKRKRDEEAQRENLTVNRLMAMDPNLTHEDALAIVGSPELMNDALQRMRPTDLPADADLYNWAKGDPEKLKWLESRRPGGTTINNTMGASESAFSKKGGELQAQRFDEYAQGAVTASQTIGQIDELRRLGTMIETGKATEAMAVIGPYAEMLGVDIQGLPEAQAYQAIVSRLAPTLRVPGSGSTSDFEMQKFIESLPSLGNSPEGNALIEDTLQALAEHKQAAGEIASRALSGDIEPDDAERMIRELPDPMQMWRQQTGGSLGGSRSAALGSGKRGSRYSGVAGTTRSGVPFRVLD